MLVLNRKQGEKIRIGHDIVVEVQQVKGRSVKLDIVAPREVSVHREEVYQRIQREAEE